MLIVTIYALLAILCIRLGHYSGITYLILPAWGQRLYLKYFTEPPIARQLQRIATHDEEDEDDREKAVDVAAVHAHLELVQKLEGLAASESWRDLAHRRLIRDVIVWLKDPDLDFGSPIATEQLEPLEAVWERAYELQQTQLMDLTGQYERLAEEYALLKTHMQAALGRLLGIAQGTEPERLQMLIAVEQRALDVWTTPRAHVCDCGHHIDLVVETVIAQEDTFGPRSYGPIRALLQELKERLAHAGHFPK